MTFPKWFQRIGTWLMKLIGMVIFVSVFSGGVRAAEELCIEGVCREVETGPLLSLTQDTARMPLKAIKPRVADLKFWIVTVADVAISIAATRKLVNCRHDHGIGPCVDGGYGEFKTREGLRQAFAGGATLISFEIKKIEDSNDDKYKFWWALPVGNIAWNASGMVRNATHGFPPKEKE